MQRQAERGQAQQPPEQSTAGQPAHFILAAQLLVVAVHPVLRGQQLGRRLLDAVEGALAAAGVQLVVARLPMHSVKHTEAAQQGAQVAGAGPEQTAAAPRPASLWQGYVPAEGVQLQTLASMQGLLLQQGGCLMSRQLKC